MDGRYSVMRKSIEQEKSGVQYRADASIIPESKQIEETIINFGGVKEGN